MYPAAYASLRDHTFCLQSKVVGSLPTVSVNRMLAPASFVAQLLTLEANIPTKNTR